MSSWHLKQGSAGSVKNRVLPLTGGLYQLNETDLLQFEVRTTPEERAKLGEPRIFIGSSQLPLQKTLDNNEYIYCTPSIDSGHEALLFLNYFGYCEVILCFDGLDETYAAIQVDVRARPVNARLATDMLGFIAENVDDMVSLCFSHQQAMAHSKLSLLKEIIDFLSEHQMVFTHNHPHTWQEGLHINEHGLPSGTDSVYWALTHLDQLSPARPEEANVCYQQRGYRFESLPDEHLLKDTDVFENRVLHGFITAAGSFLITLRSKYQSVESPPKETIAVEKKINTCISFSQALEPCREIIINRQVRELNQLIIQVEQLQKLFSRIIPAKSVPGLQPRMTAYVIKNQHYCRIFKPIMQWYQAPEPPIAGLHLLVNLKNLSSIYELTSLLMLTRILKEEFNTETIEASYRHHHETLPFGGISKTRPEQSANNYFRLKNDHYLFEVFYEPYIYTYDKNLTQPGDLVDISDLPRGKNKRHYFSPDFVLRLTSHLWREPLIVVLDAKYCHAGRVRDYYLPHLTQRYLLGIHQIKGSGSLGISPVKLLLLLFAHQHQGEKVSFLASKHWITGTMPVLPQAAGLLCTPGKDQALREWLRKLIDVYHNKQSDD